MFKLFVVLALIAFASAQRFPQLPQWRPNPPNPQADEWWDGVERKGVLNANCPQREYEDHEEAFILPGTGCNDFIICNRGYGFPFICPHNLHWDSRPNAWSIVGSCNWASEAPCNGRRWFTAEELPVAQ